MNLKKRKFDDETRRKIVEEQLKDFKKTVKGHEKLIKAIGEL